MNNLYLSIIIPVYNEEENIRELFKKLTDVCKKIKYSYEIIFIDDGSCDGTLDILLSLQNNDKSIKIIKLSRNHGHQLAISAGIDHADGKYNITMDADLQHPPELIPQFIDKADEGYDIVSGVKEYTVKRGFIKNILSACYYMILKKITNINVEAHASDYRLYTQKALQVIKRMRERERYLRGLSQWIGFRHGTIQYICPERFAGKPKYTLKKLAKLASYGVFAFSAFPLRVTTYVGIVIVIFNVCYIIFSLAVWINNPQILPGYTSLVIFILFLFSFLFISIGILGEYVLRIYEEVKQRPLYVIDWKKGFNN